MLIETQLTDWMTLDKQISPVDWVRVELSVLIEE